MERKRFKISGEHDGMRIDNVLHALIPDVSKRKIRQIIDAGGAYHNQKRIRVASRPVRSGDTVQVEYDLAALSKLRQKLFVLSDADILHDADGLFAINKPPGLASQPTRDQAVAHVVASLSDYLKERGRPFKDLMLVHRLDKETSGIILVAANPQRGAQLMEAFKERTVQKTYWAICLGIPPRNEFMVECFLSDVDRKTGMVQVVRSGGKQSRSEFTVLAKNTKLNLSLIECRPSTGRTHQLRVHLAAEKCPIVGDKRYGKPLPATVPSDLQQLTAEHQFLHARAIAFNLPDKVQRRVSIEALAPRNFVEFCKLAELST